MRSAVAGLRRSAGRTGGPSRLRAGGAGPMFLPAPTRTLREPTPGPNRTGTGLRDQRAVSCPYRLRLFAVGPALPTRRPIRCRASTNAFLDLIAPLRVP